MDLAPLIQAVRIGDLKPAPYNPRTIDPKAREGLRQSLREFGNVQPLVWNRRSQTLVSGHQRLEILIEEGAKPTDKVDVVVVDLDPAREKALNLSLNSPTIQGRFSGDARALLLEVARDIPEVSERLRLPELEGDLKRLLARQAPDRLQDPSAPPPPKKPSSKPGDLYLLGEHRLVCGDARLARTVGKALDGLQAHLVFTDPPYGVAYEAPSGKHTRIEGDNLTRDALLGILSPAFRAMALHSLPTAPAYVWHASATRETFAYALSAAGYLERQYLIWAKPSLVLGHADYQWAHEPCFYAAKGDQAPTWYGDREQTTVWRLERREARASATVLGPGLIVTDGAGDEVYLAPRAAKGRKVRAHRLEAGERLLVTGDTGRSTVWEIGRDAPIPDHPTQKPVALAARALTNSSAPGDRVLDLFAGSGSTLLAAEQLGRRAACVELSPAYCDVVVARWEELTGRKADRKRS